MKTRNIIGALVVGVLLVAAPGAQADWIPVVNNYSLSTEHIGINGPMRTVFVRLDKPGMQNGKRYAYMVVRQEVNCNDWTMSVLSIAKYDKSGKAVDSATVPRAYQVGIQIFPETNGDVLAKRVCAISSQENLQEIKVLGEFGDDKTRAEMAALQSVEGKSAPPTPAAGADSTSPGYSEKVQRRVRPNIVWAGETAGLETIVSVRCASTGTLLSATIRRSSGNEQWDQTALRAVQRSDPMPVDVNGQAPASFTIPLRPAGG
ncbi:hypothetical protein CBA19CS22_18045 [Caballeronia novacaledonica]|uniref:Uncharacterized protein n=1 Tax=Caballeronia novacaledonica TaxID=1544861 RepID=A0ACB5QUG6_9BURK|nr:hypothetical protein CBA19CS22_18045 [Caballeronia novacaledonica]